MRLALLCLCLLAITAVTFTGDAKASTFVVDDVADPTPITGTLTLRQAITAANAAGAGPHDIRFQIPGSPPFVIQPFSQLPAIVVDGVAIDGFTQPGASAGMNPPSTATLLIEIDGSLAGPAHGLILTSSYNAIRGLVIRNFMYDGIRVQGTTAGTNSNQVYSCFVGTDVTGSMARPNAFGTGNVYAGVDILCPPSPLILLCTNTFVEQCLISGNQRCGVQISSCPPSDCWNNTVFGNYIGTDITGTSALGNAGTGVVLAEGTHDNHIGYNLISANGGNGVDLTGNYYTTPPCDTRNNTVYNNAIGTTVNQWSPLGNSGRGISCGIFEKNSFYGGYCNANRFTSNVVSHNFMAGLSVWEHPLSANNADQETFWKNVTRSNGGLGIDLGDDGSTANDPGDLDAGANQQLNFPIILSASYAGGSTTVTGVGDPSAEVHLYRAFMQLSDAEGDLWLGSVWPNPVGYWTLTVTTLIASDWVTAIAMDWAGGSVYSNTSEFAAPMALRTQSDVTDGVGAPAFGLALAGLNPFRSTTAFRYEVPEAGHVTLQVFDARGGLVRTLLDETVSAGAHGVWWNGAAGNGGGTAAGVYFVVLDAGGREARLRVVKID